MPYIRPDIRDDSAGGYGTASNPTDQSWLDWLRMKGADVQQGGRNAEHNVFDALTPYGDQGWQVPPAVQAPVNALSRLFGTPSHPGSFPQGPDAPGNSEDMNTLLLSMYGGNAMNLTKMMEGAAAHAAEPTTFRAYRGADNTTDLFPPHDRPMWSASSPDVAASYAGIGSDLLPYGEEAGQVAPLDLSFHNPMIVDAQGRRWSNIPDEQSPFGTSTSDDLAWKARRAGHDGLVIRNVLDSLDATSPSDTYAALRPGTVTSPLTGETLFSDNRPSLPGMAVAGMEHPQGFSETAARPLPSLPDGLSFDFSREGSNVIGVMSGDREVGVAHYRPPNTGSMTPAQISHLLVDPEFRRRGIANALQDAIEARTNSYATPDHIISSDERARWLSRDPLAIQDYVPDGGQWWRLQPAASAWMKPEVWQSRFGELTPSQMLDRSILLENNPPGSYSRLKSQGLLSDTGRPSLPGMAVAGAEEQPQSLSLRDYGQALYRTARHPFESAIYDHPIDASRIPNAATDVPLPSTGQSGFDYLYGNHRVTPENDVDQLAGDSPEYLSALIRQRKLNDGTLFSDSGKPSLMGSVLAGLQDKARELSPSSLMERAANYLDERAYDAQQRRSAAIKAIQPSSPDYPDLIHASAAGPFNAASAPGISSAPDAYRAYHGTSREIDHFVPRPSSPYRGGSQFPASWFTSSPRIGSAFADQASHGGEFGAPQVMPVNIDPTHVRDVEMMYGGPNFNKMDDALIDARAQGYHGVRFKHLADHPDSWGLPNPLNASDIFAMFEPGSVRSATTGETLFSDTGRPSLPGMAVAGAEGQGPIRVYHGAQSDSAGPWWSPDPGIASRYARAEDGPGRVYPGKIDPKNPFYAPIKEGSLDYSGALGQLGLDSLEGTGFSNLQDAARFKGHDFIVYKGMHDVGGPQTQYEALVPGTVTSPLTGETLFSDGLPSLMGPALQDPNDPRNFFYR